jgi:ribosomal protein S14
MKYLVVKDNKIRLKYFNNEINFKIQKFIHINLLNNKNVSSHKKKIITKYFVKKNLNTYKSRLLRRCVLTNRGRVSSRIFSISRVKLKDLLKTGQIPGFYKNIW